MEGQKISDWLPRRKGNALFQTTAQAYPLQTAVGVSRSGNRKPRIGAWRLDGASGWAAALRRPISPSCRLRARNRDAVRLNSQAGLDMVRRPEAGERGRNLHPQGLQRVSLAPLPKRSGLPPLARAHAGRVSQRARWLPAPFLRAAALPWRTREPSEAD